MIDLKKYMDIIADIKTKISTMTYQQAFECLNGFNDNDEQGFFDFQIDELIGTVWNDQGRPIISPNGFFEIWLPGDNGGNYHALSFTESELIEQWKRTQA